jgi:hypothetical protein
MEYTTKIAQESCPRIILTRPILAKEEEEKARAEMNKIANEVFWNSVRKKAKEPSAIL